MKRFNFVLPGRNLLSAQLKEKIGKIAKNVGVSTKYNDDHNLHAGYHLKNSSIIKT